MILRRAFDPGFVVVFGGEKTIARCRLPPAPQAVGAAPDQPGSTSEGLTPGHWGTSTCAVIHVTMNDFLNRRR